MARRLTVRVYLHLQSETSRYLPSQNDGDLDAHPARKGQELVLDSLTYPWLSPCLLLPLVTGQSEWNLTILPHRNRP
jgi:hypothetical protein